MTAQSAVTIVARVEPGRIEELRELLHGMGEDPAHNAVLPLAALPGVHFARLLLVEEGVDPGGDPLPAHLVYLSDVDGSVRRHLGALVATGGEGLDRLFGHCRDYPRPATPARRLAFLRARLVRAAAAYVNTVGRTAQQIRHEAGLREELEAFLDGRDWSRSDPEEVRRAIATFLDSRSDLTWARRAAPGPDPAQRLRLWAERAALLALALLLLPALLLIIPAVLVAIRLRERRERRERLPDPTSVPPRHEIAIHEDLVTQNPFSAVGFLQPSRFRRTVVTVLLRVVHLAARHLYNRGRLAGIRTIHFARWVFLDDKRRMLFASNYDGSLESYVDDFIDKVAWGLNAVFSNGVGYPPTRWLVLGGAKDEQAFKAFIRAHQLPTQVWYSAYPGLTAANAKNNARIRAGLAAARAGGSQEWLARL